MLAKGVAEKLRVDLPLDKMGPGGEWVLAAEMGEQAWMAGAYTRPLFSSTCPVFVIKSTHLADIYPTRKTFS
jgi:hypothetical protein